ncbi:MAG: hypothetical protein ACI9MF_002760 [Gammaproteobacteria bacterium]
MYWKLKRAAYSALYKALFVEILMPFWDSVETPMRKLAQLSRCTRIK